MARVALLVNFIPPYRVSLYQALQERVGQLKVFVSTPMESNRGWPVEWEALDVVIQRNLTVRKRWRDRAGFTDAGFVHFPYDTLAQLRRFKPDVIISSELGLRTVLAALYKQTHRGVRLIIWATLSERTEMNRGRLRNRLRPWLLERADAVLVNGTSGARYVEHLGVPAQRLVMAPYTTNLAAFRRTAPRPPAGDAIRLLFTGMFVERKGVLPFLSALQRWAVDHPQRCISFDIAGDGPLRAVLTRFETAPNLTVTVLDAVPYDGLPALYASADVYVMPTLADEWGVVVNEAMAAALPVLGSCNSQAVEELVTEGETGWTFQPETPDSIYAAIDRALLISPHDRARMGRAACDRVFQLTPDIVAARIAGAVCQNLQSS